MWPSGDCRKVRAGPQEVGIGPEEAHLVAPLPGLAWQCGLWGIWRFRYACGRVSCGAAASATQAAALGQSCHATKFQLQPWFASHFAGGLLMILVVRGAVPCIGCGAIDGFSPQPPDTAVQRSFACRRCECARQASRCEVIGALGVCVSRRVVRPGIPTLHCAPTSAKAGADRAKSRLAIRSGLPRGKSSTWRHELQAPALSRAVARKWCSHKVGSGVRGMLCLGAPLVISSNLGRFGANVASCPPPHLARS